MREIRPLRVAVSRTAWPSLFAHPYPNLGPLGFGIRFEICRVRTPRRIRMLEECPYTTPPLDHSVWQRTRTTEHDILTLRHVDDLQGRRNRGISSELPTNQDLVATRRISFVRRVDREERADSAALL